MADSAAPSASADAATWGEINSLERAYDILDLHTTASHYRRSQPLHRQRQTLIQRIPHFWPLVFEQATPDVDQFIQPSDSELFAACLTGLWVERFECPEMPGPGGDTTDIGEPRSLSFRFEFAPNPWFEDSVLEKRFWHRRAATDDWEGLVSEPVKIHWKEGRDLTQGMTDAAVALFQAQQSAKLLSVDSVDSAESAEAAQKACDAGTRKLKEHGVLKALIDDSIEGSQSFFAWFGYRGRWISAAESAVAMRLQKDNDGSTKPEKEKEDDMDIEDDESPIPPEAETEVFPEGDDLALSLAEEIWPDALSHFLAAQEDEEDDEVLDELDLPSDVSELDAEELEALGEGSEDEANDAAESKPNGKRNSGGGPPRKKQRT